jgi:hypothetical protein
MDRDEYFMMLEDFSYVFDCLRAALMYLDEGRIEDAARVIEEAMTVVSRWV